MPNNYIMSRSPWRSEILTLVSETRFPRGQGLKEMGA